MRKEFSDLTPEQQREIAALLAMPDDQINTDDIPEVRDWSGAKRGVFYRPRRSESPAEPDSDTERRTA